MLKERIAKKEDEEKIGWIKRFMEHEGLIPGFHDEVQADPAGTIRKYGFPLTPEEVSFDRSEPGHIYDMKPVFPETAASTYAKFMKSKIASRDQIKMDSVPSLEAMRKWHKRQSGRCLAQLGARSDAMVHVPFTMELADGCSVGCEFCGLNAGKLKSIFRYTDENALLFREILVGAKELIGDAAGQGTLYFASEPLDNPDYELFLKDFMEVFHKIPQITTAVALRHKDRLHELLKDVNEEGKTIYRFSCLSLETVRQIFKEFTPKELVYTELLPQFEEAPGSAFANAGRRSNKSGQLDNTISCVSGFVVNFARKTVRLTTPVPADEAHPTGEILLGEVPFEDSADCINAMKEMIRINMSNLIGPKDRIRVRKGFTYKEECGKIIIENDIGARYEMNAEKGTDFYKNMFEIMSGGYHTKSEVVTELLKPYEGAIVRSDLFHYCINRMWESGILELESGKV